MAVDNIFDFESGFVGLETGDGFGGGGLVGQPEEGERVGGLLEDFDARGVGDGVGIDPDELAGVDGGLAVLGSHDEESLAVDSFVLEALDDLAEGLVDEVVGGEESGGEGGAVFGFVTSFLLGDIDGLEVAAEEGGGFAGEGTFGVGRVDTFDPVEEGGHMQLVVFDHCINGVGYAGDFGKVAKGKTFAAGTTNQVVCRVLVCVGGGQTSHTGNLEDGVDSQTRMRIDVGADAIDELLR